MININKGIACIAGMCGLPPPFIDNVRGPPHGMPVSADSQRGGEGGTGLALVPCSEEAGRDDMAAVAPPKLYWEEEELHG